MPTHMSPVHRKSGPTRQSFPVNFCPPALTTILERLLRRPRVGKDMSTAGEELASERWRESATLTCKAESERKGQRSVDERQSEARTTESAEGLAFPPPLLLPWWWKEAAPSCAGPKQALQVSNHGRGARSDLVPTRSLIQRGCAERAGNWEHRALR